MHVIILDEEVIRALENLPYELRARIMDRLRRSKSEPRHFFKRLKGRPEHSLRVGDWRVIAGIDDKTIMVILIGHRKNVYDG